MEHAMTELSMKEVFLPVLDGTHPAGWQPWHPIDETCLQDLNAKIAELDIKTPSAQKFLPRYRLSLLLHPSVDLFKREDDEWKRIVGAVIDARITVREECERIQNNYLHLLSKVGRLKKPWFRDLGFYLVAITSDNSQEQIDFAYGLKTETERQLNCTVQSHRITNPASFVGMIDFFNSGLPAMYLDEDYK